MKETLDFNNLEKYFDASARNLVEETFNFKPEFDQKKAVLSDGTIDLPVILNAVQTFVDNGDIKTARKILSKLLIKNPQNADVFDLLAQCYLVESNFEYAVECLNEALKIEPKFERYKKMAGIFIKKKDDGRAAWLLKDCLAKIELEKSDSAEINFALASCLFRMQEFEEAEKTLSPLLIGATSSEFWTLRAKISFELKDFRVSLESFEKALALNENDSEALIGLAQLRKNEGKLKEAIALLDRAIQLKPDNLLALTTLVEYSLITREYLVAAKLLKNFVEKIDRHPKILYCLAMVQTKLFQDEEALELLREIENNPELGSSVKELSEKILRKRNCDSNVKREPTLS